MLARRVIRYISFTPRPPPPPSALTVPGLRKVRHFEQFGQIEVTVVLAGVFVFAGNLQHSPSILDSAQSTPGASCSQMIKLKMTTRRFSDILPQEVGNVEGFIDIIKSYR